MSDPAAVKAFFEHCQQHNMQRCPCCDHLSLKARGDHEVCSVCFWEDDGTNDVLLSTPFNPNHMTLLEGRQNYLAYGACDRRSVAHVEAPSELQAAERSAWRSTLGGADAQEPGDR